MTSQELTELMDLPFSLGEELDYLGAATFAKLIANGLSNLGRVQKEVLVADRGDGCRGKIDFVVYFKGEPLAVEVDRCTPRRKSIYKTQSLAPDNSFVITRSPFRVIKV